MKIAVAWLAICRIGLAVASATVVAPDFGQAARIGFIWAGPPTA
jgi:hypothetical protein